MKSNVHQSVVAEGRKASIKARSQDPKTARKLNPYRSGNAFHGAWFRGFCEGHISLFA